MRIEDLVEFITLSRHLNYRRTASYLSMTQPTLTKHIQALERELGFMLFAREGSSLSLTPEGMKYLRYAQQAVSLLDKAAAECRGSLHDASPVRLQWFRSSDLAQQLLSEIKEASDIPFVLVDDGVPPFSSLTDDKTDVLFAYSLEGTELEDLMRGQGIDYVDMGTEDMVIVAAKDRFPHDCEALSRNDLYGATVCIVQGSAFDELSAAYNALLGSDLEIHYSFRPDLHLALQHGCLDDDLFICSGQYAQLTFARHPDVRVFTKLDNETLVSRRGIYYLTSNTNQNVLDFVSFVHKNKRTAHYAHSALHPAS